MKIQKESCCFSTLQVRGKKVMEDQVFNPYLPECEYVPDGEAHVFGNRVYIFGSHDKFNSMRYCTGDYVAYSAPVDDLTNWTCEGVIYKRRGVKNRLGNKCIWAPDVCRGTDGRYYLYFCFCWKKDNLQSCIVIVFFCILRLQQSWQDP